MPNSSMAATRPVSATDPVVGCVVPVIIFNKVLLPAPLMPIMPTASPEPTAKLTSRMTHLSVCRVFLPGSTHSARRPQRLGYCLYALPRLVTVMLLIKARTHFPQIGRASLRARGYQYV